MLGLGDTGLSMAAWLRARGARVRAADTRAAPPRLAEVRRLLASPDVHLGPFADCLSDGVDLLAVSPGIPLSEGVVARTRARGIPVVGDIELFAQAMEASPPQAPLLAVTGTNGKSTVTALAGEMCRAAGLDCEVAGNIGPAVLDALARRDAGKLPQAWVLELSSFQLETTASLRPAAAAMLNLTEDHLDRHGSMDDYARSKARIFGGEGAQILNRDDARSLAMALPGRSVLTFGLDAPRRPEEFGLVEDGGEAWLAQGDKRLLRIRDMKLAGRHNAANALAALALCRAIRLEWAPLLDALKNFKGLAHRVEFSGELEGVRFYDDSKGTNIGATVAALEGLAVQGAKVVLIAGGQGKGQDFSALAKPVQRAARSVVLIGKDAPAIEQALAGAGIRLRHAKDMEEAVEIAAAEAKPGDAVLLSPACASFDMFRDYRHRGQVFKAAVQRRLGGAR